MIKRPYSVKQLLDKQFDVLPFTAQWEAALGRPCKQFSMVIMGKSGHGKTEFAIQLSKYLTNFGTVWYNSLEQGLSHTLKTAIKRNHIDTVANNFKILDKENLNQLTKRLNKQRSADYVVIDSIQYLRTTKDAYFEFKDAFYDKKGIIYISHQEGTEPKGALAKDVWFDVDIHVKIEGFKAFPSKRLNGGGQPYIIHPERAAQYHGEIK